MALAIKSQHGFGTRTGGEGSARLGEAREGPDRARRTHGQHGPRPRLAATRETKHSSHWALLGRVQQTQNTAGNAPVPRPSGLGWRRIQPQGLWSSLSSPPATAITTDPTDIDFPSDGEGEEVPEEEGTQWVPIQLHGEWDFGWCCCLALPRQLTPISHPDLGWGDCSSALRGVSTEKSPHCESRGAPGKIKPEVCHCWSPHDLPSPDLPSSRPANPLPSTCSSPRPFRGPC